MQKQAGWSRFLLGGIEAYFGAVAKISGATQVVATLECAAHVNHVGDRQTPQALGALVKAGAEKMVATHQGIGIKAE
jgi:hypothetical protein